MNPKYELGKEVYAITQQKIDVKYRCSYCKDGKIICENKRFIECPKCNGSGYSICDKMIYVVLNKARINNIKTTTTTNGLLFIIYTINVDGFNFIMSESDIFKNNFEAQTECHRRNNIKP